MKKPRPKRAHKYAEIGWRELVGLPDLGIAKLRAKIDTGARTSALHAADISVWDVGEARWVEFNVPVPGGSRLKRCTARIIDDRLIKNTSGVAEHRYVVETTLVLGKRHWRIEVSLADREQMEFDLILGRTAIRTHDLLVNPGRSFLSGAPRSLSRTTSLAGRGGFDQTLESGDSLQFVGPKQGENP